MFNLIFVAVTFCFSGLISLALPDSGRSSLITKLYWAIVLLLIVCVAFRDGSTLNDYTNYVELFKGNEAADFVVEPSFNYIRDIAILTGGIYSLMFIYAILGVGIKALAIQRLTSLVLLSLYIYISNILILQDMTQIRAGVASAFGLLALPHLLENRKVYFVLVIISSLFHYSGLLFFFGCLMWIKWLRNSTLFYWITIPVCYVLSGTLINIQLIPFEPLRLKIAMYQELAESGVSGFTSLNLYNPYILFRISLYYILLVFSAKIAKFCHCFKSLMFIELIALSIFPLFSIIPLVGYRGSELLGVVEIILYPLLVHCFKRKREGVVFVIGIGVALLVVNLTYKGLIKI